jgi:endo-1,4-beta-D-glucanase Y
VVVAPVIPRGGRCVAPARARAADAQAAYTKWLNDLVVSAGAGGFLRVRRPNSSGAEVNSTVSEGIAYGMLAAVYMNDQPTFDALWKYALAWPDGNGLMNWYINAAGTMPLGTGGATDADEDMAFALLIADRRWGGSGSLGQTYRASAIRQINLIWQFEVDHTRADVLTPGDQFAGGGAVINISYFAPAFYRAFGRATGDTANWTRVVESTYAVLGRTLSTANGNQSNGLVPAWSTPDGVPQAPAGTSMPTYHQLDSCRTPFRLAQDYCWNNEPRALAYLQAISGFYASVGATNIVDGYDLNGAPHPQFASVGNQSAAFVGPAGVGAMATPANAALRDQAYTAVAGLGLLAGSQYYNESWTVLSLIMMTGLMDDLTLD